MDLNSDEKLNTLETSIRNALIGAGWFVGRGGWPDFLCSTIDAGGNIHWIGVESKGRTDELSESQRKMHRDLALVGIPVYVLRQPSHVRWLLKD